MELDPTSTTSISTISISQLERERKLEELNREAAIYLESIKKKEGTVKKAISVGDIIIHIPPPVLERELLKACQRGTPLKLEKLVKIAAINCELFKEKKFKAISKEFFQPVFSSGLKTYLRNIGEPLQVIELCLILRDYETLCFSKPSTDPGIAEKSLIKEKKWNRLVCKGQDHFYEEIQKITLKRAAKINREEISLFMVHGDEAGKVKLEWRHIHKLHKSGDIITYFFMNYILSSEIEYTQANAKRSEEEITKLTKLKCLYRIKAIINMAEAAIEKGDFHLMMYLSGMLDSSQISRLRNIWEMLETEPLHQNSYKSFENLRSYIDPLDKHKACRNLISSTEKEGIFPFINPFMSILFGLEKEIAAFNKEIRYLLKLKLDLLIKDPDQFENKYIATFQADYEKAKKKRTKYIENVNKKTKSSKEKEKMFAKKAHKKVSELCNELPELIFSAQKALADHRQHQFASSNDLVAFYRNIVDIKMEQKTNNFNLLMNWIEGIQKRLATQNGNPLAPWAQEIPQWLKKHGDTDEYDNLSYKIQPRKNPNAKSKRSHRISAIFPPLAKELTEERKKELEEIRVVKAIKIKTKVGTWM